MFGRHSDLLRKEVEVSAGGMTYKGILIEVTDEDVKLRGKTGWIILPFTQVRSISPANLGPKGFDPMRSVSSGFYDDNMQPGAPSPFAPAPPPAAPVMPPAPAFDAMGDLEPLTDLEPLSLEAIPGAQLEELPVESFDAPPPRAPDPVAPAQPAVPAPTARPPAPPPRPPAPAPAPPRPVTAPAPPPATARPPVPPPFKPTPAPAPATRTPAPPPNSAPPRPAPAPATARPPSPPPAPATPRPSPPTSSSPPARPAPAPPRAPAPPPRPAQAKPAPAPAVPVRTSTGVVPQATPEESSSVEDLFREFQLPKKPE